MNPFRVLFTLLAIPASVTSCRSILEIEPVGTEPELLDSGVESGPDAASTEETSSGEDSGFCPSARGPRMILVTAPQGDYCIDETEVTRQHYGEFAQGVSPAEYTALMPSACKPLTRDHPTAECAPFPPVDLTNPERGAFPVSCVDWCDAYAYCKWAGKRLCGALGGGPVPESVYEDPAQQDEWTWACEGGEVARPYPYGDVYEPKRCNGWDLKEGNYGSSNEDICFEEPAVCTIEVKALSGCSTPDGIYDMSGNVWEWEDACRQGTNFCRTRGGGFDIASSSSAVSCTSAYAEQGSIGFDRRGRHAAIGFRCCANP